jgi:hypothetical protein
MSTKPAIAPPMPVPGPWYKFYYARRDLFQDLRERFLAREYAAMDEARKRTQRAPAPAQTPEPADVPRRVGVSFARDADGWLIRAPAYSTEVGDTLTAERKDGTRQEVKVTRIKRTTDGWAFCEFKALGQNKSAGRSSYGKRGTHGRGSSYSDRDYRGPRYSQSDPRYYSSGQYDDES